jgi:hypothetical protein
MRGERRGKLGPAGVLLGHHLRLALERIAGEVGADGVSGLSLRMLEFTILSSAPATKCVRCEKAGASS